MIHSASIGALDICIFGRPVGDTDLAEEFTTAMTLTGVQDNVSTYDTQKLLMIQAYEAIWLIS